MNKIIVFQSDFGLVDGAVSAMYGVSKMVDPKLELFDLTHDITAFNKYEASFRLYQTFKYWPETTVFVSVVDPGVGSIRKSVVAKTRDNKYIVTPDNGTLTHLVNNDEIIEVREIDESINRLKGSEKSYTFHGRDVYAYTAARIASGQIDFDGVGPKHEVSSLELLETNTPDLKAGYASGIVEVLDVRYGSLWTNIDYHKFEEAGFMFGDQIRVKITYKDRLIYSNIITFCQSFAAVTVGESLCYINSVLTVGLAINQGNFAKAYNIKPSIYTKVELVKLDVK
ncbi:MAG: SAM hydrolase/SAM-dependent halogenase family protein [Mycoplasmatales bacterium]